MLIVISGAGLLAGIIWWWRRRGRMEPYDDTGLPVRERIADWWGQKKAEHEARAGSWQPQHAAAPQATPAVETIPPPPPPPPPPDGVNNTPPSEQMTPAAAQSDLLQAIGALVAQASAGDIKAVRRVVKTLATAAEGLGSAISQVGTRLAEPDKHYGNEIWEPLLTGGAQVGSGSMHLAQSDQMMQSLLSSTVAELADSPRQAPHHSQLNGGS